MELPKFEIIDKDTDLSPTEYEHKTKNGLRISLKQEAIPDKIKLLGQVISMVLKQLIKGNFDVMHMIAPSMVTTDLTYLQSGTNDVIRMYPYIKKIVQLTDPVEKMKHVMAGFFGSFFFSVVKSRGKVLIFTTKSESLQGVLPNGSMVYTEAIDRDPQNQVTQVVDVDNEFSININHKFVFSTDYKNKLTNNMSGYSDIVFKDGFKYILNFPKFVLFDFQDVLFKMEGKAEIMDQQNDLLGQITIYEKEEPGWEPNLCRVQIFKLGRKR